MPLARHIKEGLALKRLKLVFKLSLSTAKKSSVTKWSSGTLIAFPDSEEFSNATERWTVTYQPSYTASITPATEADVAAAVKIAVANNIPFLATGGRHGFGLGLENLQGGLAIDLSLFKTFDADKKTGLVTVGGALSAGEFADQLYDAGLMLPSGSCACPGYNGIAIGGGVGRYMGTLGLVTDRLVSARVISAAGDLITVSSKENADLFWGLRGAGANFGIITSSTFQAARAADHTNGQALNIDMYFSPGDTDGYFQHLESIADSLPGNVGGSHITLYNSTTGRAELLVNWVWFGPEKAGHEFFAQFLRLDPYAVENYKYIPWKDIISVAGNGIGKKELCVNGGYSNTYASNVKKITASTWKETFQSLERFYNDYPEGRGTSTNFEVFPNQAVAALGEDFNAYPWRDAKAYYTFSAAFPGSSLQNQTLLEAGERLGQTLREKWTSTSGYDAENGTIYVNYARGDEPLESIYGRHLPRLVSLKNKWDPHNVFRYNKPLPTRYP
ncbi:Glucooligosaccharide oxidase [Xylariaceae sp. AK1471]|nr:Glucooligosaccharide oxidase [Xylariaceae sp. AK1471]